MDQIVPINNNKSSNEAQKINNPHLSTPKKAYICMPDRSTKMQSCGKKEGSHKINGTKQNHVPNNLKVVDKLKGHKIIDLRRQHSIKNTVASNVLKKCNNTQNKCNYILKTQSHANRLNKNRKEILTTIDLTGDDNEVIEKYDLTAQERVTTIGFATDKTATPDASIVNKIVANVKLTQSNNVVTSSPSAHITTQSCEEIESVIDSELTGAELIQEKYYNYINQLLQCPEENTASEKKLHLLFAQESSKYDETSISGEKNNTYQTDVPTNVSTANDNLTCNQFKDIVDDINIITTDITRKTGKYIKDNGSLSPQMNIDFILDDIDVDEIVEALKYCDREPHTQQDTLMTDKDIMKIHENIAMPDVLSIREEKMHRASEKVEINGLDENVRITTKEISNSDSKIVNEISVKVSQESLTEHEISRIEKTDPKKLSGKAESAIIDSKSELTTKEIISQDVETDKNIMIEKIFHESLTETESLSNGDTTDHKIISDTGNSNVISCFDPIDLTKKGIKMPGVDIDNTDLKAESEVIDAKSELNTKEIINPDVETVITENEITIRENTDPRKVSVIAENKAIDAKNALNTKEIISPNVETDQDIMLEKIFLKSLTENKSPSNANTTDFEEVPDKTISTLKICNLDDKIENKILQNQNSLTESEILIKEHTDLKRVSATAESEAIDAKSVLTTKEIIHPDLKTDDTFIILEKTLQESLTENISSSDDNKTAHINSLDTEIELTKKGVIKPGFDSGNIILENVTRGTLTEEGSSTKLENNINITKKVSYNDKYNAISDLNTKINTTTKEVSKANDKNDIINDNVKLDKVLNESVPENGSLKNSNSHTIRAYHIPTITHGQGCHANNENYRVHNPCKTRNLIEIKRENIHYQTIKVVSPVLEKTIKNNRTNNVPCSNKNINLMSSNNISNKTTVGKVTNSTPLVMENKMSNSLNLAQIKTRKSISLDYKQNDTSKKIIDCKESCMSIGDQNKSIITTIKGSKVFVERDLTSLKETPIGHDFKTIKNNGEYQTKNLEKTDHENNALLSKQKKMKMMNEKINPEHKNLEKQETIKGQIQQSDNTKSFRAIADTKKLLKNYVIPKIKKKYEIDNKTESFKHTQEKLLNDPEVVPKNIKNKLKEKAGEKLSNTTKHTIEKTSKKRPVDTKNKCSNYKTIVRSGKLRFTQAEKIAKVSKGKYPNAQLIIDKEKNLKNVVTRKITKEIKTQKLRSADHKTREDKTSFQVTDKIKENCKDRLVATAEYCELSHIKNEVHGIILDLRQKHVVTNVDARNSPKRDATLITSLSPIDLNTQISPVIMKNETENKVNSDIQILTETKNVQSRKRNIKDEHDIDPKKTKIEPKHKSSVDVEQPVKQNMDTSSGQTLMGRYVVESVFQVGFFSRLIKTKDKESNCNLIAVKELLKTSITNRTPDIIEIMQKLTKADRIGHFHCIGVKKTFMYNSRWCIAMEYYPKNLSQALHQNGGGFQIDKVQDLSRQLLAAMMFLRIHEIIHTDVKPVHILLNNEETVLQLAGFDEARCVSKSITTHTHVGTLNYRAPEVILGLNVSFPADLWAVACTMFEMATKNLLFEGANVDKVLENIILLKGPMCDKLLKQCPPGKLSSIHYKLKQMTAETKPKSIHFRLFNAYGSMPALDTERAAEVFRKISLFGELLDGLFALDYAARKNVEVAYLHPFIYK